MVSNHLLLITVVILVKLSVSVVLADHQWGHEISKILKDPEDFYERDHINMRMTRLIDKEFIDIVFYMVCYIRQRSRIRRTVQRLILPV